MTTLTSDTFTAADATALGSHTPDVGTAYDIDNADGAIYGNMLTNTDFGVCRARANPAPSGADYKVTGTFIAGSGSIGQGLFLGLRAVAAGGLTDGYFGGYVQAAGEWRIISRASGTDTVLASNAAGPTLGSSDTRAVEFSATGTALVLKVDGSTVVSTTDATFTAAGQGALYTYVTVHSWYNIDAFTVVFVATGTTYTQSLTGSTSPTGGLSKLAKKRATGAATPTGALLRSHGTVITGASTNSGALKRVGGKGLSGVTTPVGVLIKRAIAHLVGVATSAGVLLNFHGSQQSCAGASTPTGTLQKVVLKRMAGSATPVGLLTSIAGTTPGSFTISPNTFSGRQPRALALFGDATTWSSSTTWSAIYTGANLSAWEVVVTGSTTGFWYITPGTGVGTITLSDGLHSAILNILATVSDFDELTPCNSAGALDELTVCA